MKNISALMPMLLAVIPKDNEANSEGLQLSPIKIREDYAKEWRADMNDFVCLTMNGELISSSLYRVGGFGVNLKQPYFMLLKYVEAFYSKEIMRMSKSKDPKHLEGRWCIIDSKGNEKVEFKAYDSAHLVKNSCLYSIRSNYYNIETGEFYCNSSGGSMDSADYIFLNNQFDKDKSKRGVMKINKQDGTWELYPLND